MTLCDSLKLIQFGIAKETTQGTPEAAPNEYVYLVNDESIKVNRTFDTIKPSSSRDLTLSTALAYTTSIRPQIWAFPENNGLGHLLTGAMGLDTATLDGTTAYKHEITLEDCLPSYTIWTKSGIFERKSTNNKINTLTINSPQNKTISVTAEFLGGAVITSSDFGSSSYVDAASIVPFKSSMGSLTFGQSGALVRSNITEFNLTIDNGIRIEEGIVHGQYYPRNVMAGDRVISGDITFWMENDDEALRFFEGVDTQPTATSPTQNPGLVSLDILYTGSMIETGKYYKLQFTMDNVRLNDFDYIFNGTRIAGKLSFQAIYVDGDNLLTVSLENTRATKY